MHRLEPLFSGISQTLVHTCAISSPEFLGKRSPAILPASGNRLLQSARCTRSLVPSRRPVITVRRIDAKYIHQETVWPTQWQPFIPWVHEETDYMGECDMRGTVRDAKDAQRVYNVNVSSLSEAVNDAPKNRVVGYKGQFGKPDSLTRRGWEETPNKRFAFLEVEPITIDGKPAPFPQAFNVEPAIMGLAHAISQADNDLKATGRFHDASLAQSSPGRPSSPGSGRTS